MVVCGGLRRKPVLVVYGRMLGIVGIFMKRGKKELSLIPITLACPPYDRIQALINKSVTPEGIDLNILPMEVEEVFWRQLRYAEFDVSEASLSSYTMLRSKGDTRFIAIPAFTSRFFRHSCIFVNKNKGINKPEDLKGKVVGVPEYQLTAPVWQRGALYDDYGVRPRDVNWRTGGIDQPGRVEKLSINLPEGVHVEPIPPENTLSDMLHKGELDALLTPRMPSCFINGSPNVERLFPNFREIEEDYFRRTGIFPIMHTIVIRREIYEANRWIATSLYKAFCEAKEVVMKHYDDASALYTTIPWLFDEIERTRASLGDDFWPYGIGPNLKTLEVFFRYHHEQGLSAKKMTIEDLFAPETLDSGFKI